MFTFIASPSQAVAVATTIRDDQITKARARSLAREARLARRATRTDRHAGRAGLRRVPRLAARVVAAASRTGKRTAGEVADAGTTQPKPPLPV
jgi:hypothetical protein